MEQRVDERYMTGEMVEDSLVSLKGDTLSRLHVRRHTAIDGCWASRRDSPYLS